MSLGVKVLIDRVNDNEIFQLENLMKTLQQSYSHTEIVEALKDKNYVVTVDAESSAEIKEILSVILRVVDAERILLDT